MNSQETGKETMEAMHGGWNILISQAKIIATLPLEEWLEAFERAETLGPILDPTLYREYIYDPEEKGELLKDLIRSAVPLKREIQKLQKRFSGAQAGARTAVAESTAAASNRGDTNACPTFANSLCPPALRERI